MAIVSQPSPREATTAHGESLPFPAAAAWLRDQAPHIACGSRDFGRGYALAITMLEAGR